MVKYKVNELTPKDMKCGVLSCPSVYEITPEDMGCGIGIGCPGVYDGIGDDYLIIGEKVSPSDFGLEKKVGEGEVLIRISKIIIDGIKNK